MIKSFIEIKFFETKPFGLSKKGNKIVEYENDETRHRKTFIKYSRSRVGLERKVIGIIFGGSRYSSEKSDR